MYPLGYKLSLITYFCALRATSGCLPGPPAIRLRVAGYEAARRQLLQYGYSLIATPLIEAAPIGLEVATGVSSPKLSIENTATYPLFELV